MGGLALGSMRSLSASPAKQGTQERSEAGMGAANLDNAILPWMLKNQVHGASVAVARRGQLVHARGYGWTDRQAHKVVQPHHLFRIASISKPLTAVAVLQLVEQGIVSLKDPIVKYLPLQPKDPRFEKITVLHLLQHSGGFARSSSFDPMFHDTQIAETLDVPLPVFQSQIIRFMADQPLDFDPGTRHAYSNFGYTLLGEMIQVVSQKSYQAQVQSAVLTPLGVQRMQLGKTAKNLAHADEVSYVPDNEKRFPSVLEASRPMVPGPYGRFHLEPMAAHGGWLATAVDLVRFATAIQGFTAEPILQESSQQTLRKRPDFTKPTASSYYGCGVSVRPVGTDKFNVWHNGALNGTNSLWVMRHDGFAWAILFSQRSNQDGKSLVGQIDGPMHRFVDQVTDWPSPSPFEAFL